MKVLILMGLPSSGKTTFALQQLELKQKVKHVDVDRLLKEYKKEGIKDLSDLTNFGFYLYKGHYTLTTYILDGLIHTNEQLVSVIKEVIKNKELIGIEIHYWKENREQCLINDKYRHELSCVTSIKNLVLDIPDLDSLKSLFNNISIEYHEVSVKPDWLIFSDKYGLGCTLSNPYVRSDSWSTGGSYSNCWNDSIYSKEADEPLKEFKEFDSLIVSIKEDISLLAYKNLYSSSVSIGTSLEADYYGGKGSNYAFYQCNVETLYKELVNNKLIKEIDL